MEPGADVIQPRGRGRFQEGAFRDHPVPHKSLQFCAWSFCQMPFCQFLLENLGLGRTQCEPDAPPNPRSPAASVPGWPGYGAARCRGAAPGRSAASRSSPRLAARRPRRSRAAAADSTPRPRTGTRLGNTPHSHTHGNSPGKHTTQLSEQTVRSKVDVMRRDAAGTHRGKKNTHTHTHTLSLSLSLSLSVCLSVCLSHKHTHTHTHTHTQRKTSGIF